MNFKPFLFSLSLSSTLIYGCGSKDSTSHGKSNNPPKAESKPEIPAPTPTPTSEQPPYKSSFKYLNINIKEYCEEVISLETDLNLIINKIEKHVTTLESINNQYHAAQREIIKRKNNKLDENDKAQIKALTSKIKQINSIFLPSKYLESNFNLNISFYFKNNLNRCINNNTTHLKELIINEIKIFESKIIENNKTYIEPLIQNTEINIQNNLDKSMINENLNKISFDFKNIIEKLNKLNQNTENK
ncbi:hypothetical protein GCL60_03525 [Silvanigrella paludirubra]|uniref:Uncharacterized protein n=1 Tax=Silvanigrella paludirubra TaxID=2499159 RepID=A0A6N6VYU1_9BACT|nr:hypothetical protein [Silvanigrella paludirubra]KAB8041017.1 hypothetical protein GCL60_03525 [Silvanigrella paludirubra]